MSFGVILNGENLLQACVPVVNELNKLGSYIGCDVKETVQHLLASGDQVWSVAEEVAFDTADPQLEVEVEIDSITSSPIYHLAMEQMCKLVDVVADSLKEQGISYAQENSTYPSSCEIIGNSIFLRFEDAPVSC